MPHGVPLNVLTSQQALRDYFRGMQGEQRFGQELDAVVRTFGHLSEGFSSKCTRSMLYVPALTLTRRSGRHS